MFQLLVPSDKITLFPVWFWLVQVRVKDDTIIVTCYNAPIELNLQENYQGLPAKLASEGINPKIPWLYDYKLDFRFK
jgi:hypothetical protein